MSLDELPKLLRRARRKPIFEDSDVTKVDLGREQIERLLPHRGTMLLLDKITGVAAEEGRIRVRRKVVENDPVFEGHFPGDPVYPGALQMEAIGQATLCLHHFRSTKTVDVPEDANPNALRLLRVIDASFLGAVRPGDTVEILGTVIEDNGYTFVTMGQMWCNDVVVSVAAFEAMILEDGEEFS